MTSKCIKPPQLRPNFIWHGQYIVSDLFDPRTGKKGITVPMSWQGNNGNIQITAGNGDTPIYFTNLIYNNQLFTYTYKWPHLQAPFLPPLESTCPVLEEFSLGDFNAILATSRFVGPATINGHCTNHFRCSIVFPINPPGFYFRFPFALIDIFSDPHDPTKWYQVLHFGLQNIYDPALDEWIQVREFSFCPGVIIPLPPCTTPNLNPVKEIIEKIQECQ
jgi:hypothetical protein